MNEIPRETPLDRLIDGIVDGALRPGELRLAFSQLDREPDGWKRCTLAFLEAQCWRDSFRALEVPFGAGPGRGAGSIRLAVAKADRARTTWWRGAAAAVIIAASFAFGWLSHVSRPLEFAGPIVPVPAGPIAGDVPRDTASEPVTPASVLPLEPAASDPQFAADRPTPNRAEIVQAIAELRIGPEGASATVPILAGPGINGDWLKAQPPPLSEYEQVVLQRNGYQVDQQRRLLIGTLEDGRRVSVPIDQVEIRYTGSNPL